MEAFSFKPPQTATLYLNIHMLIFVCVCCVYIYIYTHIHIHTHTHTQNQSVVNSVMNVGINQYLTVSVGLEYMLLEINRIIPH